MAKSPYLKFASGLLVATAAFGGGALTWNVVFEHRANTQPANPPRNPFAIEGFDFNRLRSSDYEWRGPANGDKVDLNSLLSKDGKSLSKRDSNRPFMIVTVNMGCGMCSAAADEMSQLRKKLATMDIQYYVVSFTPRSAEAQDFFKYADSLNVGTSAFVWNEEAGPPPESIFKMTTPSHILLGNDGIVIRVWPGSFKDKPVRQLMARQIVADTGVAIDTLKALQLWH